MLMLSNWQKNRIYSGGTVSAFLMSFLAQYQRLTNFLPFAVQKKINMKKNSLNNSLCEYESKFFCIPAQGSERDRKSFTENPTHDLIRFSQFFIFTFAFIERCKFPFSSFNPRLLCVALTLSANSIQFCYCNTREHNFCNCTKHIIFSLALLYFPLLQDNECRRREVEWVWLCDVRTRKCV